MTARTSIAGRFGTTSSPTGTPMTARDLAPGDIFAFVHGPERQRPSGFYVQDVGTGLRIGNMGDPKEWRVLKNFDPIDLDMDFEVIRHGKAPHLLH